MSTLVLPLFNEFYTSYQQSTPLSIQLLDKFAIYSVFQGVVVALYLVLAGTFPFNSFLAAFIGCVGFFILLMSLRLQLLHHTEFGGISKERSYADYMICNIILLFVVVTFIG